MAARKAQVKKGQQTSTAVANSGAMVNAATACIYLDISAQTLRRLISEGHLEEGEKRGKERVFNVDVIRVGYIKYLRAVASRHQAKTDAPGSLVAQRARLAKEQADKQARENALADGVIASVEDIAEAQAAVDLALKHRMEAIGVRISHEVAAESSPPKCKALIDKAVSEAFTSVRDEANAYQH
jgi:phage terminase Nu1 subunit (DNA packaging protein)